ncbi:XdhC family protein [Arthrobacter sp. zg-Y1219]|uniref:XdhC family protein n=1 Tax=Arthrobacter sp. zg-Y1219 TaxID=3049067 RepID=UPI0024C3540D|nr:XdhC family protein [Arthrobacter sp. zg-Y1219]MDK1361706.1 XdhC family protein [Arthrobacter sp. zg-Y1219]
MLNILDQLIQRWRADEAVAVSTVIHTSNSAPLPSGSSQMVTVDGEVFGSVSGGCVEGAVYEENTAVLRGEPPAVRSYGFSDADAWSAGLTCGGTLEVFSEQIDQQSLPWLEEIFQSYLAGRPLALATVLAGPAGSPPPGAKLLIRRDSIAGSLNCPTLDERVTVMSRELMAERAHGILCLSDSAGNLREPVRVFVETFLPRPRLLVFGAVDFSSALAEAGSFLGYRVTVCDARPVFATQERFPSADEVVSRWPHEYLAEQLGEGLLDDRTAICVLTHDAKFDVPLLEVALQSAFSGYVGAMGSRRTHEDRMDRLRARGLGTTALSRLHSPIGLDLGGRTPQETAVSIVAEILAFNHGRSAAPLGSGAGTIHAAAPRGLDERDRTSECGPGYGSPILTSTGSIS